MQINQENILRRAAQHLNDITGYASDERIDHVRRSTMTNHLYHCGIVSNGEYLQWLRDDQSYEPKQIHSHCYFASVAEAESHAREAFAEDIESGDHLIIYSYDDGNFVLAD